MGDILMRTPTYESLLVSVEFQMARTVIFIFFFSQETVVDLGKTDNSNDYDANDKC